MASQRMVIEGYTSTVGGWGDNEGGIFQPLVDGEDTSVIVDGG